MNHSVKIGDQEVPVFGSLDSKQLAVVDLEILKRITENMQFAHFDNIQERFIDRVRFTSNIDRYLIVIEEELRFHKTVNDITQYQAVKSVVKA